ncbi:phenylacetyl-CoA ligase-like protein [Myriangium duriaei CBS 260.36]|uniref:Phenylacetyl-CoA ligase-like protein n=1 Tax=Myriangium duriaei CBS 260.36 TaxID=1168546 RepID=A0A9P4J003_9PEZI|nr:phenylacetyl-CoA ligase-like protein [Myriangium duriaei CBS 260.36]
MPFYSPSWVPKLPFEPPSNVSIEEFMLTENYGRYPLGYSRNPFTCGLTGKTYSALEVRDRVDALARGLSKELAFEVNDGTEYDKVIGVFSVNTLDTITLAWATHRLGGIQTPANAQYSQSELEYQLKDAGAKCLFTCLPLLEIAKAACKNVGIPENRIYLLAVPEALAPGVSGRGIKSADDLIKEGSQLERLPAHKWREGEGTKRTAFLCYSSGTSGLPKGVMISHRNVIANTLQTNAFDSKWRKESAPADSTDTSKVVLGLLPMSHIYSLIVCCHVSIYRGDAVIILPKFEMTSFLESIARFKIEDLFLVPPIIITMTKSASTLAKYDLSSVKTIFTGAAPLGEETSNELQSQYPKWTVKQGYGLTETSTVVSTQDPSDLWAGSCGSLLPGFECRLVTIEGNEITGYDQPGELWVKGPSVTLGYLNNIKATRETYVDGYMRTGDEAVFRKHPKSGNEHLFITDRIKELIKVKGLQVAPAELEAHLLTHPAVNDCVVIGIPSDKEGEVPKAFVVKSPSVGLEESEAGLKRDIARHVEKTKARHKWLKGGIEFIDVVPKSPSGKILRRLIRDKDRESRRAKGAKL